MCLNLCWNLDARNVHNHVHIRQKNLKKWLFEAWAKRRNGIPGWNCPKKVIMGRCNASLTTITLKWLHKNQTGMRYRTLWIRQYLTWNSQSHVVLAVFGWKKGVKLVIFAEFVHDYARFVHLDFYISSNTSLHFIWRKDHHQPLKRRVTGTLPLFRKLPTSARDIDRYIAYLKVSETAKV